MEQPIEDADVVSEGPKPPPPPPRVAELKPSTEQFSVFDGPVDDPPNVKRKAAGEASAPRQAAKGKGKGGKRAAEPQAPPEPPIDPVEAMRRARRQAERAVDGFVQFQLMLVRQRYMSLLEPASLEELCARMRFSPEEREMWVEPLAEGFLENGIVFPWWARLAIAAVITIKARQVLLSQLELQVRAKQEADAAAAEKKT